MLGAASIFTAVFWLVVVPVFSGFLFSFFLPEHKCTISTVFISGFLLQASIFECISVACMIFINPRYKPFYICSRIFVFFMLAVSAAGAYIAFKRFKEERYFNAENFFIDAGNKPKSGSAGNTGECRDRNNGENPQSVFSLVLRLFPGERRIELDDVSDPDNDLFIYKKRYTREGLVYLIIFAAILIFQLYMAVSRSSFDGDDAYYVVQSLQAQTTGTMYRYNPYIGYNTPIDIRHALAMFPIWSAFVAYVSGIHSTIFVHTVLPVFLIPFTYIVYSEIAGIIFKKNRNLLPLFMCILSVYQMFGNVSIYTSETFFLTRTWQGKSVLANIALPLVIWLFCRIFDENMTGTGTDGKKDDISPWLLIALNNFFAGMATSMGVMLVGILVGILTIALVLHTGRLRFVLYALLSELPAIVYVILYLVL